MLTKYHRFYNHVRADILLFVIFFLGFLFAMEKAFGHVDLIGPEGVHLEVQRIWDAMMAKENEENRILELMDRYGLKWGEQNQGSGQESEGSSYTGSSRD